MEGLTDQLTVERRDDGTVVQMRRRLGRSSARRPSGDDA
jgi:hypothetical protein